MSTDWDPVRTLLILKVIVAALGEKASPPWWRTQFLNETSLRMMQRIYPRTAVSAAVKATSMAACSEHDRKVGGTSRYHLFRLPTHLESAINDILNDADQHSALKSLFAGDLHQGLSEIAQISNQSRVRVAEGPLSLGSADSIPVPEIINQLAAHYFVAFRDCIRVFPYFEGRK